MGEQSICPPHDSILFQKVYGNSAHLRSHDSWHRYVSAGTNESIHMGVRHDTAGRLHSASSCTCKAPQRSGCIQKRGTTDSSDVKPLREENTFLHACLLYTSDAADDLLCVDLGGRRIIKKKKN